MYVIILQPLSLTYRLTDMSQRDVTQRCRTETCHTDMSHRHVTQTCHTHRHFTDHQVLESVLEQKRNKLELETTDQDLETDKQD